MKITYIGHSGFSVELEEAVLIFDYYQGTIPEFDGRKPIYVFVSHKHHDHFNQEIFALSDQYPDVTYILSSDTRMNEKYMERRGIPAAAREHIIYIGKNVEQVLQGPGDTRLTVETLASTDEGVAFLVGMGDRCIYHAGDLNWWSWEGESDDDERRMEENFKREMKKLEGRRFDAAFLPLDPRQEDRFSWGFDVFMRTADAVKAIPMHFWGDYSVIPRLLSLDCSKPYRDRVVEITREGQVFEF